MRSGIPTVSLVRARRREAEERSKVGDVIAAGNGKNLDNRGLKSP